MDKKIFGNGNFELELHYYGYGEWHTIIYKCKTFKTAYRKARLVQRKYAGALYFFYIMDWVQYKTRWTYFAETSSCKFCNVMALREGKFDHIIGYKASTQGV